ncbi:hypothetical protein ACFVUS_24665 [Nocardia sp. NPDC058058]|uniref:hypothetical protein n=1 Tax=Nocardia sp. NPDC058058 TaxID=3346317 RepID=UPI0036D9530C
MAAVAHARREFGANLAACYAIGSLAHGGFAPLVSDVDLAIVLNDATAVDLWEGVARVVDGVEAEVDDLLAQRLSIFWSDWSGVRRGAAPGHRLPAIDRLDLLQSGRLLHGSDYRGPAVVPGRDELLTNSVEFALAKIDRTYCAELHDPARLITEGVRVVTKRVLFPVRFLYTLDTSRIGRNEDAIDWYRGRHHRLVRAAGQWRYGGLDATAEALLSDELIGLYIEFVDAYSGVVADRADLAQQLAVLRRRLVADSSSKST